jgi:formylglycine-generating enzyme required for sulfatase activity
MFGSTDQPINRSTDQLPINSDPPIHGLMPAFNPLAEIPELIAIPGGEYDMGQQDGRAEERPVHRVQVGPFALGRFQVTNAQYDVFVRSTRRNPARFHCEPAFCKADQPVVGPTWFDAVAYCQWLAGQAGKLFRLPTEAEWEWAARGGLHGRLYPWGDDPPTERAGYRERWIEGPERVGESAPNGYGLFDICENVHEWCSDWYDPEYYQRSPLENPVGPATGTRRSSRGGAWRHQIKIARCAARSSIPPELEYSDYGFRVACG